jgi:hypothetical protein
MYVMYSVQYSILFNAKFKQLCKNYNIHIDYYCYIIIIAAAIATHKSTVKSSK